MADPQVMEVPLPRLAGTNPPPLNLEAPPRQRPTMPLTDEALGALGRPNLRRLLTQPETMQERLTRPDVPLDVETGIPEWQRLGLGVRRAKEDQLRYLETKYGKDMVRMQEDQWIVTVKDADNKDREILVDPARMDAGDFMSLLGSVPELAGDVAAAIGSKRIPGIGKLEGFLGGARTIVSGAVGGQLAGGAMDTIVRASEGVEINYPEIARSRTALGVFDVALGGTFGTGVGTYRFLRNPFLKHRTDVQLDAIKAQKEIAEKYNVFIELTPGELTGSPGLSARELFLEKVPGSSGFMDEKLKRRAANMQQLQNIMVGIEVPPQDVVGRQAIRALQNTTDTIDSAVDSARRELSQSALNEMEKEVSAMSVGDRQLSQVYIGDAVRNRITALRDAAKSEDDALFARVRDLGGDEPIFGGQSLVDGAKAIKKNLPPRAGKGAAIETLPEGPIPKTTTEGTETSVAFVPSDIRSKLDELVNSKDIRYRLSDLQKMRRSVYDDIEKGSGVPGTDTHYLSEIGKLLTDTIDEGVSKMPDDGLKQALMLANKHHKEEVVPFGRRGISEMFIRNDENGYVGSAELASRYISGSKAADAWNTLKSFVGADSIEIRLLKRQIADKIIGSSLEPGAKTLNAKSFLKQMQNFEVDNPDLFKEVFGESGEKLNKQGILVLASEKDALPVEKVEELLKDPSPTAGKLAAAIQAERAMNVAYRNTILEGVRKGKFDAGSIQPDDFVNRFVDNASTKEIQDAMELIDGASPELAKAVRGSALQKLFRRHREAREGIAEAIEETERSPQMRALFGDEKFDDLKRYGAIQRAMGARKDIAESAGSFARSRRWDELFTRPLKFTSEYVRERVSALALMNDVTRKLLISEGQPSAMTIYLATASGPMMRSIVESYGDDNEQVRSAQAFVGSVKRGLDEFVTQLYGRSQRQQAVRPFPPERMVVPIPTPVAPQQP